jgi:hypothetical protein
VDLAQRLLIVPQHGGAVARRRVHLLRVRARVRARARARAR